MPRGRQSEIVEVAAGGERQKSNDEALEQDSGIPTGNRRSHIFRGFLLQRLIDGPGIDNKDRPDPMPLRHQCQHAGGPPRQDTDFDDVSGGASAKIAIMAEILISSDSPCSPMHCRITAATSSTSSGDRPRLASRMKR